MQKMQSEKLTGVELWITVHTTEIVNCGYLLQVLNRRITLSDRNFSELCAATWRMDREKQAGGRYNLGNKVRLNRSGDREEKENLYNI